MLTTQTAPVTKAESTKETRPDFGNGRYSAEMSRVFDSTMKLFGIDSKKSERIARQAGSDAGAVFRNTAATISVSKSTKDGKVTIADASKAKGVTLTNSLAIVRAIQWIDEAGKNFVSYGNTKWELSAQLKQWVDEMKIEDVKPEDCAK